MTPARPGGPDEALVRVQHLAGPERQPAADLDPATHPQPCTRRERSPFDDRAPQVTPHRLGQAGQLGVAEHLVGVVAQLGLDVAHRRAGIRHRLRSISAGSGPYLRIA